MAYKEGDYGRSIAVLKMSDVKKDTRWNLRNTKIKSMEVGEGYAGKLMESGALCTSSESKPRIKTFVKGRKRVQKRKENGKKLCKFKTFRKKCWDWVYLNPDDSEVDIAGLDSFVKARIAAAKKSAGSDWSADAFREATEEAEADWKSLNYKDEIEVQIGGRKKWECLRAYEKR